MAISIPWLARRRGRSGRVGLAVGPDGLAVAYVNAAGRLDYCRYYQQFGDSSELLGELVAERDWHGTACSIVLHPAYYQLLLAETPPVELDEMASAVRWKIKELLDYPLAEAAIEYFLLPDDAYRGRQKMLYAAALRKTTLHGLVEPVEACGLAVDCVEIAELALHNIIARMPAEGGGTALVQLYDGEGIINLVEDGAIYLSRRLDVGLDKFNADAGADNALFFDALFLEIQRSLDYYESQLGKGIITHLFYSPGLADTAAIGDYLSSQLGLNVAALNLAPLDLIDSAVAGDDNDEQLIRAAGAIGAALGPNRLTEERASAAC